MALAKGPTLDSQSSVRRGLARLLAWLRGARAAEALRLEAPKPSEGEIGELLSPQQTSLEERLLINNIGALSDLSAEDVGVPRADIVALPLDCDRDTFLKLVGEKGHSRFPVYHDSLDDIRGMVHIRDLLPHLDEPDTFSLAPYLRPMNFVAPSVPVLDLLVQMQAERRHMALVVDEFGGIDALVTIEDLIEQIVGDIHDEHDDARAEIEDLGEGRWRTDARVALEDLEEALGKFLTEEEQEEDVDTLGGLLYTRLDRIPSRGELIPHPSGLTFQIEEADARRIRSVLVTRTKPRAVAISNE